MRNAKKEIEEMRARLSSINAAAEKRHKSAMKELNKGLKEIQELNHRISKR